MLLTQGEEYAPWPFEPGDHLEAQHLGIKLLGADEVTRFEHDMADFFGANHGRSSFPPYAPIPRLSQYRKAGIGGCG